MKNNIRQTIEHEDRELASSQSAAAMASDALRDLQYAVPFNLTFAPTGGLDETSKVMLEAHLKAQFETWAESWMAPRLLAIISKDAP